MNAISTARIGMLLAAASQLSLAAAAAAQSQGTPGETQMSAESAGSEQVESTSAPNTTTGASAPAVPAGEQPASQEAAPASGQAGDIIVTAQRRSESLQRTPVAISYFGGDQLDDTNTQTLRDLAGAAPNVQIPRFGATPTTQQIYIRGIGEGDLIYNPKVAIYIDDFFVSGSVNSLSDLTGIDHIEVLRGPQGTLYGQNSSAGAIRVITLRPDEDFELQADAGYGNYDAKQAHLYVAGPLAEGLAASLTVGHTERDGLVYNATLGKEVNTLDVTTARAKLRYYPADRVDVELAGDYTWDNSTTTNYSSAFQPGGFNPDVSYSGVDPKNESSAGGVSLRANLDLDDNLTFRSLSSYRGFTQDADYDNQGTPAVPFNGVPGAPLGWNSANFVYYNNRNFTQEFQLNGQFDRLSFASGLFFYRSRLIFNRHFYNNFQVGTLPREQYGEQRETSYAAYGQLTYNLTERLRGTLGLRVSRQKVDSSYRLTQLDLSEQPTAVLVQTDAEVAYTRVTPKVGIDFQATPSVLLYATYAQGLNGGGFDTRASNATDAATPFKPEIVTTYEGGMKSTFLDRAVRINLAGFYNDFKDFQAGAFVPATGGQIRGNAGKAHTWGVELESTFRPVTGLEVSANLGYLEAIFDEYINPAGPGTSASGNRFPRAPEWTASLGATYAVPLPAGGLKFGADMNYQSASFVDVTNTPDQLSPGVTLYNAFASYTLPDDNWSITGTIRNITDERVTTSGSNTLFTSIHTYNEPMTYLFSVQYKY